MPVSDLTDHLGFWLRYVSNHVSQRFAERLAGTGVTVAEWVVLRQMYDSDVTAPSAIASATGLTRGAISKLIERLREKDLVTRTESTGDRRFQDVRLTRTGRKLVPQLAALADQNDDEFFSALAAAERRQLRTTLEQLVAAHGLQRIPME